MAKSRQKKQRTMESSDLVDEHQESLEATKSASRSAKNDDTIDDPVRMYLMQMGAFHC